MIKIKISESTTIIIEGKKTAKELKAIRERYEEAIKVKPWKGNVQHATQGIRFNAYNETRK